MKRLSALLLPILCSSLSTLAQSLTIVPNSGLNTKLIEIKKDGIGLDHRHTNGAVGVGTFATVASGFIQTHTNHPLSFATNNGSTQMTLLTNGNFGVNIFTPLEKLHIGGNIRASSLAGAGVRDIYADANGTITTAPQTRYLMLGPMNFILSDNFSNTTSRSVYSPSNGVHIMNSSSTSEFYSPVILPNNATLTNIDFCYHDQDGTRDLRMRFECYNADANTTAILSEIVTTGNPGAKVTLSDALSHSYDGNSNKIYYVTVRCQDTNGVNIAWASQAVLFVKITYSY